jgi:glycine/D-amino acid oxidase-like deaminating enzyme
MADAPAILDPKLHVAVIGAGAFGGWTALSLLGRGARVTLFDAWGPGNSRASSGGESRVIRGMYGPDRLYTEWVARSLEAWQAAEARWGTRLYHPTGCLWMFSVDDAYARASLPLLEGVGLPAVELSVATARQRWPQVDFSGVRTLFFEEHAGYLLARRACQAVAAAVAAQGGEVRTAAVRPGPVRGGWMGGLALPDGALFEADAYVFACGPWLGRLFPAEVGARIRPTRQEVFFFGTPEGDSRFEEGTLPIWMDFGERIFYGIPGGTQGEGGRGFKVADDTRGEPIDPTADDRLPTPVHLAEAREVLVRRFPALAGAPVVEARVCQYENTPDGHLLVDRHPEADNVWLVGGGSGHGFKLGPAIGEHVASLVYDGAETLPSFRLAHREPPEGKPRSQFEAGRPSQGSPAPQSQAARA